MNGKERILKAMEIKMPDRVPLYIHAINEKPIIGIGKHLTEGLPETMEFRDMSDQDKMKLLDTLFLIHESFEVDGFTAFETGHEKTVDDSHVIDDWDVVYMTSPHGMPVATGHPLKEPDDLKSYKPPDPKREHLILLDLASERFKGEKALFWMMRGTFVLSWRLVGMENLMLKMYMAPEFVHQVAEMTLQFNFKMLEFLIEAGVDVLIVEDDIASSKSPLISPKHFAEFVEPYNRRIVNKAHEMGLKVMRHSDGNLWPLLDTILESNYDGLNPLEPQGGMLLKKVKDYCGDRICLMGNIDCIDLLPDGTEEEVDKAVKQAINDAGAGGGLIICSSNSLHPGVNPENCIAMFDSVRRYGVYNENL